MFRIKVCGVTTVEDAIAARDAGVDAIGLNFYPASPRYVELQRASEIRDALAGSPVELVGLFVNLSVPDVRRMAHTAGLHCIQLHGDEPWESIEELAPWPVVRAFRCRPGETLSHVAGRWAHARRPDNLCGLLIDAYHSGLYGGSGSSVDWSQLGSRPGSFAGLAWILAGGLTPENVFQAIVAARPDGVDTASGVEIRPGVKDAVAMRSFVEAARAGFLAIGSSDRN